MTDVANQIRMNIAKSLFARSTPNITAGESTMASPNKSGAGWAYCGSSAYEERNTK
jgi:hypothetical protein